MEKSSPGGNRGFNDKVNLATSSEGSWKSKNQKHEIEACENLYYLRFNARVRL